MTRSSRGGRRSPAQQVIDHLRAADRFPPGDPRREAAQRRAARTVASAPEALAHPALAAMAAQLSQWARFAPHLLSDAEELALATRNRAIIARQLHALRELDESPATALDVADAALRGLDASHPEERREADVAAHEVTDRRAPATASVLAALAACHLADDAQRGIADWRTRFAIVQGTSANTLAGVRDAVRAAQPSARRWWAVRSSLVGGRYHDRRVGLGAPPASLAEHAAAAADGIGRAAPRLADAARAAAARIVPGADNQVVIEADGRISATVAHRATPRGGLMVAHETGHAMHALAARSAEPPGALVGETVACWSSLVTGARFADGDAALALALGDTLVEELFVSAAVSAFEDRVYALVAANGSLSVGSLNEAWLSSHRDLWGDAVVPDHVGSGWARLPALATDPGHACSYVWATLLALAMHARHGADGERRVAAAVEAGGVGADEFTRLLGFDGDAWIGEGLVQLDLELERLAQLLDSATSA